MSQTAELWISDETAEPSLAPSRQSHTWPKPNRRTVAWTAILLVLLLLAAAARLWGISLESLDCDEAFSVRAATANVPDAIHIIREDLVHPPLYYFLLKGSLGLTSGLGVIGIRLLSLLAGIGTIGLLAYMGLIFPRIRTQALLAALCLAANDLHIFYSQQARSYSLYTLLFTGLLLWIWSAERHWRRITFWGIGSLLMSLLVYTHYVGALYVACVVAGCTISGLPKAAKVRMWIAAATAACSFVPWVVLEAGMFAKHRGLAGNLAWVEVPTFYDLKAIWGSYLGLLPFRGSTTLIVVAGFGIIAVGLLCNRDRSRFKSVVTWTLLLTAFGPPCILFVLSLKPFSLPFFGARHLLPSIVSWLLLAADGLMQISMRLRARRQFLAFAAASLLALELTPTITTIRHAPRRVPYAAIARDLDSRDSVYTTWTYGIAGPVDFYLHNRNTVKALPETPGMLPNSFTLLFRPALPVEEHAFDEVTKNGWNVLFAKDYKNGIHSPFYVESVQLQRRTLPIQ